MGKKAKEASRLLACADSAVKNRALLAIASELRSKTAALIEANAKDISAGEANGLSSALIDRLRLTEERIEGMAQGVEDIAKMSDPVGEIISGGRRPNGLQIEKIRVPLGVIGIIYEARPNVTSDAAALCLKSGNAVILKGGKEAINSNKAIADLMRSAIESAGLCKDCIQLVEDTSREAASALMRLNGYLDVLIPRGGKGLIRAVVEQSTVPVIETGAGNCHVYVDKDADLDMAANIIFNAKTSRPSVCNAIETILVHSDIADKALAKIKQRLDEKKVEIRGCEKTQSLLGASVVPASETDYDTEYLDYILACRVVENLDEAIEHITKYSSGHSECIVTENYTAAQEFVQRIDAAAVYINASTRFTDGGEFGYGAEIGISTQKLHARGPMGLYDLTSVKYIIRGNGQIR